MIPVLDRLDAEMFTSESLRWQLLVRRGFLYFFAKMMVSDLKS